MKNKDLHTMVTDEKYKKVKKFADDNYRTITSIIEEALDKLLTKKKRA